MRELHCARCSQRGGGRRSTRRRLAPHVPGSSHIVALDAEHASNANVAPIRVDITAYPMLVDLSMAPALAAIATERFPGSANGCNERAGQMEANDSWLQEEGRSE